MMTKVIGLDLKSKAMKFGDGNFNQIKGSLAKILFNKFRLTTN